MLGLILLVFAFVCACVASYGPPWPRPHFGWAAFAFYILSLLVARGL